MRPSSRPTRPVYVSRSFLCLASRHPRAAFRVFPSHDRALSQVPADTITKGIILNGFGDSQSVKSIKGREQGPLRTFSEKVRLSIDETHLSTREVVPQKAEPGDRHKDNEGQYGHGNNKAKAGNPH